MESIDTRRVILDCVYHNLLTDLNKFLNSLNKIVIKFEEEELDRCLVFIEPIVLAELLNLTFSKLNSDENLYSSLISNSKTLLAFNCLKIIKGFTQVIHKNNQLIIPYLFEQIEQFIFGKNLHEYKVWEEL